MQKRESDEAIKNNTNAEDKLHCIIPQKGNLITFGSALHSKHNDFSWKFVRLLLSSVEILYRDVLSDSYLKLSLFS